MKTDSATYYLVLKVEYLSYHNLRNRYYHQNKYFMFQYLFLLLSSGSLCENCTRTNNKKDFCATSCNPPQNNCSGDSLCVCDGDCGFSCVRQGWLVINACYDILLWTYHWEVRHNILKIVLLLYSLSGLCFCILIIRFACMFEDCGIRSWTRLAPAHYFIFRNAEARISRLLVPRTCH